MKSPHVAVLTPCYGNLVSATYMASVLKLFEACRERRIGFTHHTLADSLITRARAEMVATFLSLAKPTHLLFVDADITFEPEQVFRLLDFGADVTAAAYPLKYFDWKKAAQRLGTSGSDPEAAALRYVVTFEGGAPQIRGDFIRVRNAGAGFLMVRREALVKLCDAHPELRYTSTGSVHESMPAPTSARYALFDPIIDEGGGYLSEDYSFCLRWTRLGGDIWLDTKSRLQHIGHHVFRGDLSREDVSRAVGTQ